MVPQSKAEQEIAEKVSPLFLEGEYATALGALLEKVPDRGSAFEDQNAYVVVATNLRLLLLNGKVRKLGQVTVRFDVVPYFGGYAGDQVLEWWYQDIQDIRVATDMVKTAWLELRFFRVELQARHPALGVGEGTERKYMALTDLESLPSATHFMDQFIPQLAKQVQAGAFPLTPARQAIVEQYDQAARAQEQARAERWAASQKKAAEAASRRQERAERTRAKLGVRSQAGFYGVIALVVFGLLGLLLGAAALVAAASTRSHTQESNAQQRRDLESVVRLDEADVAWSQAGGPPPSDCPDRGLPARREMLDPSPSGAFTIRQTICHGCRVFDSTPTNMGALAGLTPFEVGGQHWFCPPAATYRAQLDADRARRESLRETRQPLTGFFIGGVFALLGLALLAGAAIIVVRGRARG
jgi:hypothetical protein